MSFELFQDRAGRTIRPRKGLLAVHRHANFGGKTESGIIVEGPSHLPTVFGVIYAIRHDNEHCVLNCARDAGGLMPGDLVYFERYSTDQGYTTDVSLTAQAERYNEVSRTWEMQDVETIEPIYMLSEESVMCRVDGVLPDPWEEALANLPETPSLVVPSAS